jgi:hypothetical protein
MPADTLLLCTQCLLIPSARARSCELTDGMKSVCPAEISTCLCTHTHTHTHAHIHTHKPHVSATSLDTIQKIQKAPAVTYNKPPAQPEQVGSRSTDALHKQAPVSPLPATLVRQMFERYSRDIRLLFKRGGPLLYLGRQ